MHTEVAITGMGVRLPQAVETLEDYWQLLRRGTGAVIEVPGNRWEHERYFDPDPKVLGKTYCRWGGFLSDVAGFDASLFGISPAAAIAMDPQHRMLLETIWASFETAGRNPRGLAGSSTGVFVAMSMDDYSQTSINSADFKRIDSHSTLGNVRGFAAGRVSYCLGLTGPSLLLDATCSSSLASLHMACQSLRAGECDVAVAAAVHLMLTPASLIAVSKLRALSPTGECRAFDANANGYVRGEGAVSIVLRRLSDAIADRDPILAIVKGSALNHNGRSNGFTAPSKRAQVEVIRTALTAAQVSPEEVQYIEAHGTGTPIGDPIELSALASVFGERDESHALLVGSVKTNLGHLEAAAGLAGVAKVVLGLQRRQIPPQLNFDVPSPHFQWSGVPLRVVTKPCPWPDESRRRFAGVSSFGMSGSNAHAILAEAPSHAASSTREEPAPLLLSARSAEALRTLAARCLSYLQFDDGVSINAFSRSLYLSRPPSSVRAAAVVTTVDDLRAALEHILAGSTGLLQANRERAAAGNASPSGNSSPTLAAVEHACVEFTNGGSPQLNSHSPWNDAGGLPLPPTPFERKPYLRALG